MKILLGSLLLTLLVLPQDPLEKRIATILERLRAEEIEHREAAAKDLISLGEPAAAHLEKVAADTADPEVAARLKGVVAQIRRNVLIEKVAPAVKLVTVSAKDVPLYDFLKDVCAQAGVEFHYDGPAGSKTVTVEAKGEPLLQVVDRACAARGDLVPTLADGKLKIAAGKFPGDASAYVKGYRIRVRKTVLSEITESGGSKTNVVLYFDLDAQPDQKVRTAAMTSPRAATVPGGGEIAVKGVADAGARMGAWMGAGAGAIVIDGVAIAYEVSESLDRICFIKEAPAGLKKLESLKVGARYRYSVGLKPVKVPLVMNQYNRLPDIPYQVHFSGQQLYFMTTDMNRGGAAAPLEDFVDIDSISLIGKDGTEVSAKTSAPGMRGRGQYVFQSEKSFAQTDPPQLKIQVMDAIDRDVEFELKDIKLRD